MLYGASAIESLLEDMDGILDKSHAVTPEEWAHRGLLRRMFEPILRVFFHLDVRTPVRVCQRLRGL